VWRPDHPRAGKRSDVFEHIVVAEQALGRYLRAGEVVHHINHVRSDNRSSNLLVCRTDYHHLIHARERALLACGNPNWRPCCICTTYDATENMYSQGASAWRHRKCFAAMEAERRRCFTPEQRADHLRRKRESEQRCRLRRLGLGAFPPLEVVRGGAHA
jgi:hypothetical protein